MAEPVTSGVLLELDQRRRVTLGKIGRHEQYLARVESDGTIILTPAVVMKVSDLEALVGPRRANVEKKESRQTLVRTPDAGLSRIAQAILATIRAGGPDGVRAGYIVDNVPASRSQIYNELAILRRHGKVTNPNGRYTVTG